MCLFGVLMINTSGDLGQWKSEVSECSPWRCHSWGYHPLNRRVQDRKRSSYISRLHTGECPLATGVRLLVPERADDQLRHGSRGHCHHNAGEKDKLPSQHTKVGNWKKYSWKSFFLQRPTTSLRQLHMQTFQLHSCLNTALRIRSAPKKKAKNQLF